MTWTFCIPTAVHITSNCDPINGIRENFVDHELIVEHKYLENGHTNMESGYVHSAIEKAVSGSKIYSVHVKGEP